MDILDIYRRIPQLTSRASARAPRVPLDELTDRFEIAKLRTAPSVIVLIAGRLVQRRGLFHVPVHRFVKVAQQVAHCFEERYIFA